MPTARAEKLVFGVENGTWAVTGFSKEEVFQKMDAITNAIFDSCEPKDHPEHRGTGNRREGNYRC